MVQSTFCKVTWLLTFNNKNLISSSLSPSGICAICNKISSRRSLRYHTHENGRTDNLMKYCLLLKDCWRKSFKIRPEQEPLYTEVYKLLVLSNQEPKIQRYSVFNDTEQRKATTPYISKAGTSLCYKNQATVFTHYWNISGLCTCYVKVTLSNKVAASGPRPSNCPIGFEGPLIL